MIPITGCVNHQDQLKGAALSNNCISFAQPHTDILNPQETAMSLYADMASLPTAALGNT